jgi:hypothetical protein
MSSIKHGQIARVKILSGQEVLDLVGHEDGLIPFVYGLIKRWEFALLVLCPKVFSFSKAIPLDDGTGRLQYQLSGPIVLLEADHPGVGKVVFKAQYISEVSASPAVNGLVIVPDHADVSVHFRQRLDEAVLDVICILKLVDQHVHPPPTIVFQNVGMGLE